VLTEGVEDGLTAALADPRHRVWAMISLGNMATCRSRSASTASSCIARTIGCSARRSQQFERGKAALEATGRPVVEVAAIGGKDLNDTLRGEE
jgi:hypothetical protein